MATTECDYTVSDVYAAFQMNAEHLGLTALDAEELQAFEHIDDFSNKQNVCYYEEKFNMNTFYHIKDQHTILTSNKSPESKINVDVTWRDYIEKAMKHRLVLTAKRYLKLRSRVS